MAGRQGIMLAYAYDEKRFLRYPKPCIVQPKIEGDRCRAVFDDRGNVTLLSSSAKERVSIPHIKEQLESLKWRNQELDGELYIHGVKHQDIRSIVSRTKYIHPRYEDMEYHIFDNIQEQVVTDDRIRSLYNLKSQLHHLPSIKVVEFDYVSDIAADRVSFPEFPYSNDELHFPSSHRDPASPKSSSITGLASRSQEIVNGLISNPQSPPILGTSSGIFIVIVFLLLKSSIFPKKDVSPVSRFILRP